MLEISDLLGLNKPLTKLIEVVSQGVGGISAPILTRKKADAKAYEIKTIAEAISESQKLLGDLSYQDGSVSVSSADAIDDPILPDVNIEKRVLARLSFQENKKQQNIEKITQTAANELKNETDLSDDSVDEDWIARFFRIAEDVSSETIQILWGKILAGEVKNPGAFSLRTLEHLKNISQTDAEIFVNFSRYAIKTDNAIFVPNTDNGVYLKKKLGFDFPTYLHLRELGLLFPNDLSFQFEQIDKDVKNYLFCGSTCLLIERQANAPLQKVNSIIYTEVGNQLYNLIEKHDADQDYLKKVATLFKNESNKFYLAKVRQWTKSGFKHNNFIVLDL